MPPPPRNPTIVNNMLQLHTIKPNPGAKHRRKRLGNGESSGLGKTCGKGNKGQKARSGGSIRPGFEGGQMPLHRRLPKKGFNNTRFQDKPERSRGLRERQRPRKGDSGRWHRHRAQRSLITFGEPGHAA